MEPWQIFVLVVAVVAVGFIVYLIGQIVSGYKTRTTSERNCDSQRN